jgi:hypothetical protein
MAEHAQTDKIHLHVPAKPVSAEIAVRSMVTMIVWEVLVSMGERAPMTITIQCVLAHPTFPADYVKSSVRMTVSAAVVPTRASVATGKMLSPVIALELATLVERAAPLTLAPTTVRQVHVRMAGYVPTEMDGQAVIALGRDSPDQRALTQ